MGELIAQFAGTTDLGITAGIGILVALVLTQAVKALLNAEHWWILRNPWQGANTDRLMPIVALLIGAAYGWATGSAPGLLDNIGEGIKYGGWSIVSFQVVKKTLLGQ